jgi:DNA-binding beta-propeller fold protein YncE
MLKLEKIAKGISFAVIATSLVAAPAMAKMKFEHVLTIGSAGTGKAQFKYVEDFAFTNDGKLLVTDAAHAYVQVFDKKSGEFIARFGGKGDDDANLEKPEGISVDPAGRIFVADYTTGDVKVYDKNYKWLSTFREYGSEAGQNIKSEFTDIRYGLYYMPEAGNHRVSVWDLNGNFKFLFGGKGTEDGKMNNPESAKFNSEGKLYVADLKNDRIQVFDKDGKFLFKFGESGSGEGQLKAPAGIGFVSEIGNTRRHKS